MAGTSRMSREAHVRICGGLEVRLLRSTRPVVSGPSASYQPNGRFWGQSGRSIRLENDILTGIYRPKAIIGSLSQSSKMPRQDHWVESRLSRLACKVLSIGDSGLLAVSMRWTVVLLDKSLGTTVLRLQLRFTSQLLGIGLRGPCVRNRPVNVTAWGLHACKQSFAAFI